MYILNLKYQNHHFLFFIYGTSPTPRVSHRIYNPDIKHPLKMVISKVSIGQFCTRYSPFLRNGVFMEG